MMPASAQSDTQRKQKLNQDSGGPPPAIFPRRKAGQERNGCQGPVLITLDVLEAMADVTLSDAAKKLGVSKTPLTKACRKLGVLRWPYRKKSESAKGVPPADLLAHYNEAYVRKSMARDEEQVWIFYLYIFCSEV
jgi:hypothetical protein